MSGPKHKARSSKNIDLPGVVRIPFELGLIVVVILIAAGLVAATFLPAFASVSDVTKKVEAKLTEAESTFHRITFPQTSTMYAADEKTQIATINGGENRLLIKLKQVAPITQDAVLAIEDHDFYNHGALDATSIVRAALANISAGHVTQGGSTITQQLVKNAVIGSTEQTFQRKFQEAALSARMEREYTKEQILELYLNEIYLGNGVYGIGAAAEYYFAKPASQLNLVQSALLAGMIQSPEGFNPTSKKTRKAAHARRNVVLDEMANYDYITAAQAAKAKRQPVTLNVTRSSTAPTGFYAHHVVYDILNMNNSKWDDIFGTTYEQRLYALGSGGFKIYTMDDLKLEAAAQQVAQAHLGNGKGKDTGIASVDPTTGAVKMLLSGKNYERDQLDLAAPEFTEGGDELGIRQPGSSFKPYTLVTAFKQGIQPSTVYSYTSPMKIDGWHNGCGCVENAEGPGSGSVSLWTATADSINAVFAQLIMDVGPAEVVKTAMDMGVKPSPLLAVPSLTLGSVPVSPLEQASGYATLANHGLYCPPYYISKIVGPSGHVVYKHQVNCKQVIDAEIADLTTSLLEGVVTGGTGTAAALGRPVAGKTGTSQDSADLWFVGYTPQLSTAVWVGYPLSHQPQTGEYGGTVAAPIWHDYMVYALRGMPSEDFPPTPTLKPPKGKVPDVVGMKVEDATAILEDSKYFAHETDVPSDQPKGEVTAQSPAGGASAPIGTSVTLEISTGTPAPSPSKAPETKIPDVEGQVQYDAQKVLVDAGFKVWVRYVSVLDRMENRIVLSQSPKGGSDGKPGQTVTIAVGHYTSGGGFGGGGPSPSP